MKYIIAISMFVWSGSGFSLSYEQQLIHDLDKYIGLTAQEKSELLDCTAPDDAPIKFRNDAQIPLFKKYPVLRQNIPYVKLGSLPTSIHHCKKLGAQYNKNHVYIKCDSETGGGYEGHPVFGGNKVRKLEFLLADAIAHGARTVLTFGCAGSNHALATAAYAKVLGLNAELFLFNQPNSHIVQRNLLLDGYYNAHLNFVSNRAARVAAVTSFCKHHKAQFCSFPYIIPVGGSCPRGIVGFVNAAFELKEQIDAGIMPEPKYIIVPCGSTGTVSGLMLGCRLAGLKSTIVPVAIEPDKQAGNIEKRIMYNYNDTAEFLAQYEPACASVVDESEIQVIHAFTGDEYGLFTEEAVAAIRELKEVEGITLDGVYSGKAVCALFSWMYQSLEDDPVLFWNTFCSDSFDSLTSTVDYTRLPVEFHRYFTEEVQPLDR